MGFSRCSGQYQSSHRLRALSSFVAFMQISLCMVRVPLQAVVSPVLACSQSRSHTGGGDLQVIQPQGIIVQWMAVTYSKIRHASVLLEDVKGLSDLLLI